MFERIDYMPGDTRILKSDEPTVWDSIIDWTHDVQVAYNLSNRRISYLWEKYGVVDFMMEFEDLYCMQEAGVKDVKEYIEGNGGSLYD